MSPPTALPERHSSIQLAENFYQPRLAQATNEEAIEATYYRAGALLDIDQDERLAYMESDEWGFSTDHLRQVNRVMDAFLDDAACQEIRNLAKEYLDEGKAPLGIAGRWLTGEKYERLQELLDATDVPDPLLVACYARLEVHEVGQAAYLLAENRTLPQPDFASFHQTAEEIETDLRFVNAV
ncbi:MAG: hypothetical protein OXM01_08880 [Gemmatimonadota bacterium]|nr:hypothetical protein [Gemmatimonadota bacterium]